MYKNTNEQFQSENTLIVQQWIAAFNDHKVDQLVDLYAENAELYDSGMKRKRRGRKQIQLWFTERFRGMPALTYSPQSWFEREGQIAVSWIARGQGPKIQLIRWLSKKRFEIEGVSVFKIESGKIFQQHGYYDHLGVAQQLVPTLKWLLPIRL